MTARRVRSALVVVAILLCLSSVLLAQNSKARIVRLSYIDGDARIDQAATEGEQRAIVNMPVIEGTRLTAEDDSRVEVEFENGSTLRLYGPSEVVFRELSLRNSGDKVTLVEVKHGLSYFDVIQKGDDDFRILLNDHNLKVQKNSRFRADAASDGPKLAVFKGELELLDAPDAVVVKKNETISFDSNDAARYELAKDVDPLGADQWDRDRAEDRELYARSQEYKHALSYSGSPYSYGMYDMASYGSWYSGPGGACWRPAGFGMGWDPFSTGAWTYYPSMGWVFVSGYPWGWTPYRYGSWNYFGSTGWCWNPGGYYGWNPIPIVITQPSSYQPPRPPNRPGGPPVYIGGRKVLPGHGDLPDGSRRPPTRGIDVPVAPTRGANPTVRPDDGGGMPTAKPLTPVPSGKRWGGEERGPAGGIRGRESTRDVPDRTATPAATPKSSAPAQMPAPRSEPKATPTPRAPAPMPRNDSGPRMAPAPAPRPMPMPAPAPAPPSKTTSPHVK